MEGQIQRETEKQVKRIRKSRTSDSGAEIGKRQEERAHEREALPLQKREQRRERGKGRMEGQKLRIRQTGEAERKGK